MTKITYRHVTEDKEGTRHESGPFQLYLYSDNCIRLENPQATRLIPGPQIMIVNASDRWVIDENSKKAYYTILDNHLANHKLPLFPEGAGAEDYDDLYFGHEFLYFFINKPKMDQVDENEQTYTSNFVVNKGDVELQLLVQRPKSAKTTAVLKNEIHISYKGRMIHQYLIDEYNNTLPVDPTLFLLPSDIETVIQDEKKVKEFQDQKEREKKLLENADNQTQYNDPYHRWILACAGVLWERNKDDFATLAGEPVSEKNMTARKKLLAEWWDIKSKKDLYDSLIWLTQEGGHRIEFENTGKKVSSMTLDQYKELFDQYANDTDKQHELRIAKQYYTELGDKSITGWDYTRYICLCRWGYSCGYLEEQETWFLMASVAKEIQRHFDSWEDFGQNYMIGHQFWSFEQTLSAGTLYTDAFDRLTQKPDSPWNSLPWDLDLSQEEQEI